MIKRITTKLGNMRKPVDWVVYPTRKIVGTDGVSPNLLIQSDHRICEFDPATGKGLLSKHCANHAGFMMLAKFMGATEVTVPADVIAAALDAQPKSGDRIGKGVYIA